MGPLRSFLFVPVLKERYWAPASKAGAGQIILDLEDSIPHDKKEDARNALAVATITLRRAHQSVCIRVNAGNEADFAAATACSPDAILLPKVQDPSTVRAAVAKSAGRVVIYASIESAKGVIGATEIANAGAGALFFGAGDFCLDTGMSCDSSVLALPASLTVLAARASGLPTFGLAGRIDAIEDTEELKRLVEHAKALGCSGAPVIHPKQVRIVEQVFAPSQAEIERARLVVAAYEASDGLPSRRHGELIESPLYERARALVDSFDAAPAVEELSPPQRVSSREE